MKGSTTHQGRAGRDFERRPLTEQERGWVSEILAANKDWADVNVGDLYAVWSCDCGCKTIDFKVSATAHNPRMVGKMGPVGQITVLTKDDRAIWIILHHIRGVLTELEVVWDDFENPMPDHWEEVSRVVTAA